MDKENFGTPMETGPIQIPRDAEMPCAAEQIATSNVANRTAVLPAKSNEFYDDIEMKASGQAWVWKSSFGFFIISPFPNLVFFQQNVKSYALLF